MEYNRLNKTAKYCCLLIALNPMHFTATNTHVFFGLLIFVRKMPYFFVFTSR